MTCSNGISFCRKALVVTVCAVALGGDLGAQEPKPEWEGAWEWLHDSWDGRLLLADGWFCGVFGSKNREAPPGDPLPEAVLASLFRTMSGPMCGRVSVTESDDGTPVLKTTVDFAARPQSIGRVSHRPTRVDGDTMEGDLLRPDGSVSRTWHYRRLSAPGNGPLAGAWRLVSDEWDGLMVMTDSEYRFVVHLRDRSEYAGGSVRDLSDAEAAALYTAYDAEGGSYRTEGGSFFRVPAVARDPRLQGSSLRTAFQLRGDTLTIQVGRRSLTWSRVR